ncbi:MAG: sulfatase-like hydrolase/transferase, partial [Acidobacteriota bacterium]
MRRAPGLLPIVMVLPALAGLAPASRPDPGPGPEGAPEERPAVPARPGLILITVDGLRADRLGCYTRGKIGSTPRIDALAARGVRFERAYAASPSTAPSTATVLTGTRPRIHGLFHDLGGRLAADVPSVAGILSRAGYRTGAVVGSFHLDSDRGLDRGFDLYQDDIAGIRKKGALISKERRAEEVVGAGVDVIDA